MFSLRNRFNLCDIKQDLQPRTGNLSVTVRNRLNNEPIAFVEVSVYYLTIRGVYGEGGDAYLIVRHITDENGRIPIIELPVIDRFKSPSNIYYMTVEHFRYYPVNLMNIQIYNNVTTEYNVMMTPLTESHPEYEFHITPELLERQKK
jgi:5-hydroxyisourate hydrolase-like protein (transthyretin family)